jgi:murein DD-endopeptidase MepM/ murein hydrolase activator NlpD
MNGARRIPSGGGPGSSRSSTRVRVALSVAVATLVLCGCGQVPGTHLHGTGIQAVGSRSPAPSPNGENQGPSAGTVTYQIVVGKARKVDHPTGQFPLVVCPVRGSGSFSDDFGAPRYAGGYHPHQGNDIFAPLGTPIVAPFDGMAVRSPNLLGGAAVKVFGTYGFVYNAHLSGYGAEGPVKADTIVGYVGNTGDALGGPPHDHFEWHPGNGPAVDPFPYLKAVCG